MSRRVTFKSTVFGMEGGSLLRKDFVFLQQGNSAEIKNPKLLKYWIFLRQESADCFVHHCWEIQGFAATWRLMSLPQPVYNTGNNCKSPNHKIKHKMFLAVTSLCCYASLKTWTSRLGIIYNSIVIINHTDSIINVLHTEPPLFSPTTSTQLWADQDLRSLESSWKPWTL